MDRALPGGGAPRDASRQAHRRALRYAARRADDAAGILEARAPSCPGRRNPALDLAAHAAARVRHAPHQPRRRPARRAASARPRGHLDHADLHTRGARAAEAAASQAPSARVIELSQVSPWLFVLAPIVIVAAYTLFGLTGFGSTLISVPILAHFLPVAY